MPESTRTLAEVIRQSRERIVARFVNDVERNVAEKGRSRSMLVDHIPRFLDGLAAELDAIRPDAVAAAATTAVAREHGEQRWSIGFDLETLIREYGLLHHCILAAARDAGCVPSIDEHDTLARCLSVGATQAAAAYTAERDAEVEAQRERLTFLAEAGRLLSSSLDYRSTTGRLTRLVVPRMADWCVLHLDGVDSSVGPIAHVDESKLELLRRLYVEAAPTTKSDGHHEVLRTGEGRFIRDVATDASAVDLGDTRRLPIFEELGTRSLIMVPLRLQEQTFGVLTLGFSESGRSYDETDFALANDLARRAASAIDNARLYELSQRERARVEAATRAKDELVSMVSHELKTPLNAILGWLRLMRGAAFDDVKRQHASAVIERNAEALDRLVSDLLDISRIIAGRLRMKPSQVDLSDVVEMAVEAVRPAADAKGIRLEVELERTHASMRGDSERLEQVAWNLLVNAVKFTPKLGSIAVRLQRVESDLVLTVKDSGEGIEPSFLPYVFEIFQQADRSPTRLHGGLGIGLSIVKHIVDLHGGTITAESDGKGKGATFSVQLPTGTPIASDLGIAGFPRERPAASEALPGGLAHLRVLVVEDNADARELLTVMLESAGIEVLAATTVAEALSTLASSTPTVICSDIELLDQDGYALIRAVRAWPDPEKRRIPAIALAALGASEERARALMEGFNVFLTKPVEPGTLLRTVADLAAARPG